LLAPIDTAQLLRKLGYVFEEVREPRSEPPRVDVKFEDVVAELAKTRLRGLKLYEHQWTSFQALRAGYNLILRSGTGSGKTEAWVLHALKLVRERPCRVLALYPTLALANDQVRRLQEYSLATGVKVLQLDAPRREELERLHGRTGLRKIVGEAQLVVSNPAFVLYDVKRLLTSTSRSVLEPVYRRLCLLVIDELDFYGPRSIALLLALIEVLVHYSEVNPQIAILTATLANPEDLAEFLTKITGRKTRIVDGKPFHPENRVYIVLGKNIEELRKRILEAIDVSKIPKEVVKVVKDPSEFARQVHRVTAILRALGYDVPSPGTDYVEILSAYASDPGVTLVFTRSIGSAEQVYRRLREKLGELVAVHHHLVPKKVREEVEEKARRSEVKLIVTPRTLLQGIDIGTVVRIVHLGLPEDVREFVQREGRKGRRPDIAFTETIIVPASRWDRELLVRGVDTLRKWLALPLEKTIVNPDNMYKHLFTGLAKLVSPWYRGELTQGEQEALRSVGILTEKGPKVDEARRIWDRLSFYEYGPPYGVKRYLVGSDGREEPLEPIGLCDLVEKFQVGCIDPSTDAIVVGLRRGRSSRTVTAVVEKPLTEFRPWELDAIAEAYEDYREAKMRWREEPNLLRDVARGKLVTEVLTVVYPPRKGFGLLRKIPNRVVWMLYSDRPKLIRGPRGLEVTYDRRTIYVPVNTAGEYRDYTYGLLVEASETDSPTLLRLGLAYLVVLLRRYYSLPLELFKYGVEKLGDKKFIEMHEPEAAGVLPRMDWSSMRKIVEQHEPDELDEVLLMLVDELAYTEMLSMNNPWHVVREAALRVIDLLTSLTRLKAVFAGRRIEVPKPSRTLRILTIDVIAERISPNEVVPEVLVGVAGFDGEEAISAATVYAKAPLARPPRDIRYLESTIEEYVYYDGFKLVVYDRESLARALQEAGLRRLEGLVEEAIEVKQLLPRIGLDAMTPPEHILEAIELEGYEKPKIEPHLADVVAEISRAEKVSRRLLEMLKAYLEARCRSIYITYLVLSTLVESKGRSIK
jgi:DEAD/DEAH box helicase domain-containing protein